MKEFPPTRPEHIHFLLMLGFSMLGLICAMEPLRAANRLGGRPYEWHIASSDGRPGRASDRAAKVYPDA